MGKMREYNIVRVICKETVVACLHWVISVPFPEIEKKKSTFSLRSVLPSIILAIYFIFRVCDIKNHFMQPVVV